MNRNRKLGPMPSTICVQPDCPLKDSGLDSTCLAKILQKALAGNSLDSLIPEGKRIDMRSQCLECIERVMLGGRAFLTASEWDLLNELGQWHRRRERRRI
ncbi:MAG: hypothetical protein ACI9MF_002415 [Gammaproteobacteria bacterium]|jgi:hypothetical protein